MLIATLMWKFHIFFLNFAPPLESFAPENLDRAPLKKFLAVPPFKKS